MNKEPAVGSKVLCVRMPEREYLSVGLRGTVVTPGIGDKGSHFRVLWEDGKTSAWYLSRIGTDFKITPKQLIIVDETDEE